LFVDAVKYNQCDTSVSAVFRLIGVYIIKNVMLAKGAIFLSSQQLTVCHWQTALIMTLSLVLWAKTTLAAIMHMMIVTS